MQTSDVGKTKTVGSSGTSSGADTPIQDRGEGSSERSVFTSIGRMSVHGKPHVLTGLIQSIRGLHIWEHCTALFLHQFHQLSNRISVNPIGASLYSS